MDAFFASVEQRDHPHLRGKPIAVGGNVQRGVVAAASYEARKFGVHSAMPAMIAKRKCPDLLFVPHRFDVYKEVSREIQAILYEFSEIIEPLSLDEAYLDLSARSEPIEVIAEIAAEIRQRIKSKTELTASAGISFNKFLAKIASGQNKPNGQFTIQEDMAIDFLLKLPIHKFHGIGKSTAQKMRKYGIHFGVDLQKWSERDLKSTFGKSGAYYYKIVRAIDNRPVVSRRVRKSISVENTFQSDLSKRDAIELSLKRLSLELAKRIEKKPCSFKTIVLKIRFSDFRTISRNTSFDSFQDDTSRIYPEVLKMIDTLDIRHPIRLLGIGITNLKTEGKSEAIQLSFDF